MTGLATRQEPPGEYLRCMIEAGTDPNTASLLYMLLQDCVMTAAKPGTSTHTEETCRQKTTTTMEETL